MKPIKITMSAFGPFCDSATIDFSVFNNGGIFLVTGDTGSGKTTIFDAICFALYGKASGGDERRNSKSFRSDYAKSDSETFVEFEFSHKDINYTIRRNPEYERASKRGESLTKERAKVHLTSSDGIDLEKESDVSKKINEIIGLDYSQFSQTVMIPQNDFLKIINSKSDDRIKLFNKLFHTDKYRKIQDYLQAENKFYEEEKKKYETIIKKDFNQIVYDDKFEKAEDLKTYARDLNKVDEVIGLLSLMISYSKGKFKVVNDDYKALNKENNQLIELIALGSDANTNYESFDKYSAELEELDKKQEEINNSKDILNKAKIAQTLEKEDLILSNEIKLNEDTLALIKQLNEKKEESLKEINELDNKKEEITNDYNSIESKNEKIKFIDNAIRILDELELKNKEKEEFEKSFNREYNIYVAAENIYIEARNSYYRQQYGLIAKDLKDGAKCPVCGSTNHPEPAQILEGKVYSLNDVEKLEEKKSSSQSQYEKEKHSLDSAKARINELQTELDSLDLETKDKDELNKLKEDLSEFITNATNIFNDFNSEYASLTSSLTEIDNRINEANSKLDELKENIDKYQNEFNEKLKENGFESFDDYQNAKLSAKEISEYETKINEFEKLYFTTKNLKDEYEKKIKGKARVDITSYNESKALNDTELARLEEEKSSLQQVVSVNTTILKDIKECHNELKDILVEYAVCNDLYNCVSGNISGEAKLSFEAYILRYYFKQVIAEANRRLNIITNGEFTLRIKEEAASLRSKTGLDLEVLDRNTGKWRDVSTLSGGESFIASLSLALGLSDFVQARSGVVRLDAMFIDEGFGTLDDDALNQAIRVLQDLSDGKVLVGIISHVNELKNKILRQVIVTKSQRGSSVKVEIN